MLNKKLDLPKETLERLFEAHPSDTDSIVQFCKGLSGKEKQELAMLCEEHGLREPWCQAMVRYASIYSPSNTWDLSQFDLVYSTDIGSWWIDSVHFATTGHRFAMAGGEVLSFPEFHLKYGLRVSEHLREFVKAQHNLLETAIQVFSGPMVERELTVSDDKNRLTRIKRTGPAYAKTEDWQLPAGYRLVDTGETPTTLLWLYKETEC